MSGLDLFFTSAYTFYDCKYERKQVKTYFLIRYIFEMQWCQKGLKATAKQLDMNFTFDAVADEGNVIYL